MFVLGCDKVHSGLEAVKVDGVYRISGSEPEGSLFRQASFFFLSLVGLRELLERSSHPGRHRRCSRQREAKGYDDRRRISLWKGECGSANEAADTRDGAMFDDKEDRRKGEMDMVEEPVENGRGRRLPDRWLPTG